MFLRLHLHIRLHLRLHLRLRYYSSSFSVSQFCSPNELLIFGQSSMKYFTYHLYLARHTCEGQHHLINAEEAQSMLTQMIKDEIIHKCLSKVHRTHTSRHAAVPMPGETVLQERRYHVPFPTYLFSSKAYPVVYVTHSLRKVYLSCAWF
jgi:hypothetical protein